MVDVDAVLTGVQNSKALLLLGGFVRRRTARE